MNDEILGVIYPLKKQFIDRIINGKKVFLKFPARVSKKKIRLRPGHKLFLYQTQSNKILVVEAKILKIAYMKYDEVINHYKDGLFLSQSELKSYVGDRKNKEMLILFLDAPLSYSSPIMMKKPLTMAGRYMTKELYEQMFLI